jgi:predicted aldo/keto reductase-like oxidoreductase
LEYVDFLCIHNASNKQDFLNERILNNIEKAKKDGKIRFVGVSVHQNEPEIIQACTDSKFYDFVMTSHNFRQKHYLDVRQAIARAAQAGLGVITFKVMGGEYPTMTYSQINASAALKWVLQDPNVHTIVPGISSFDHINIDLAVMEDLTPTDSEKDYLQKHASLPGLYCQGCGQCEKQCLAKLPIPDLMRAYMYSYGYRKPTMAQELILPLGLPSHVCEDCGKCPVKCMNGWDIQGKVRDIVRLRNVPLEFLA